MSRKTIIIDGEKISSAATFYEEVESKLTKNLDWQIGRNLNAFNDILRGGFGIHDYEEPITLIWLNSSKSRRDLREKYNGEAFFEAIVRIIISHDHIEFKLK